VSTLFFLGNLCQWQFRILINNTSQISDLSREVCNLPWCILYKRTGIYSKVFFRAGSVCLFRHLICGCVRRIAKSSYLLRHACLCVCPPVRTSAWKSLNSTGQILMEFDIWRFFGNLSRKFKFYSKYIAILMGTLHENVRKFLIISHSVLRMRNVSDKNYRENQSTHFLFSNDIRKSCRLWGKVENMVEPDKPQMTIWRMRIACWISKAINTHPEYETLITFPLQLW
jgi:hypothetical protein